MERLSLRDFLVDFWELSIACALAIGVSAIVMKYYFRRSDSLLIFSANLLLFTALLSWLVSYALATRFEIDSIEMSFPAGQLTGPDITTAIYAIGMSVAFGLALVFHRYPLVVILLVLALGVADWSGNSLLIQSMREKAVSAGGASDLPPFQLIWHDYYVHGGHLRRITIYASLAIVSLVLFFASIVHLTKVEELRKSLGAPVADAVRLLENYRITFAVMCRLLICASLFLNEFLIWDIRFEREASLACYDKSFFYVWASNQKVSTFGCLEVFDAYGDPPKT